MLEGLVKVLLHFLFDNMLCFLESSKHCKESLPITHKRVISIQLLKLAFLCNFMVKESHFSFKLKCLSTIYLQSADLPLFIPYLIISGSQNELAIHPHNAQVAQIRDIAVLG